MIGHTLASLASAAIHMMNQLFLPARDVCCDTIASTSLIPMNPGVHGLPRKEENMPLDEGITQGTLHNEPVKNRQPVSLVLETAKSLAPKANVMSTSSSTVTQPRLPGVPVRKLLRLQHPLKGYSLTGVKSPADRATTQKEVAQCEAVALIMQSERGECGRINLHGKKDLQIHRIGRSLIFSAYYAFFECAQSHKHD